MDIDATFMWVPTHVGIMRNGGMDRLAKQAVRKDSFDIDIKFSRREWKSMLYREIKSGSSTDSDRQKPDIFL